MKRIILIVVAIVCVVSCKYPESEINNIAVYVTGTGDRPTQTITINAQISGVDDAIITERGFCYSGYGSSTQSQYPTLGLDKHVVNGNAFIWNFGEEMKGIVGYVRAYVIVNGIVIYSDETINIGMIYANIEPY